MTRDDVLEFAHEADEYSDKGKDVFAFNIAELTRAFEAVAAHEREACAYQCHQITMASLYDHDSEDDFYSGKAQGAIDCAHAIRARSQGGASHE